MSKETGLGALLLVVGTTLLGAPISAQACPDPWALTEVLRVGSVDGEDALSGVLDLGLGPDELLYVAQQFSPTVTVFDLDGRLSRRIGRAGTGPGEFDGWPTRLGWIGDTLWVADHAALNLFRPDGQPQRQVYFRELLPEQASFLIPWRPLADGTYLPRRTATSAGTGSMDAHFAAASRRLVRLSERGEIVGEIGEVRNQLHAAIPSTMGGTAYTSHPLGGWGSDPYFAPSPDGSSMVLLGEIRAGGSNPTFDLLRIGLAGDTLMHRSIPFEPRGLTRSDRAWLTEEFGNFRAGEYDPDSGSSPFPGRDNAARERDRRAGRDALALADFFPPVRKVVAGEDGTIWILRELDVQDRVDRWQVFSQDGELEGAVLIESGRAGWYPWAPRLEVMRASRSEVWGVTLGQFDEPYIHRYRVDSSCR